MASRAARKILREREQLQRQHLEDVAHESDSGASDGPANSGITTRANAFAMLMNEEPDAQSEAEAVGANSDSDSQRIEVVSASKPKKQNKKKKKGKGKKTAGDESARLSMPNLDDELDEIDRAVLQVNAELGAPVIPADAGCGEVTDHQKSPKKKALFAISLKLLDADAEMRRLFGSKIVADEIRNKNNRQQRGRMALRPNASSGKTFLVTPRETWPHLPTKVGVSMNMLQIASKSGEEYSPGYFEFTYSSAYLEIQSLFLQCVNSHDPETMRNLIIAYPFHVDTLLQLSEICKQNGDVNTAAEYIERALFIYERAFHPLFNMAIANSVLPYSYPENRAFHLALSRHISFTARKGCWRTCLELSKLLFSCDPDEDPLGALQMMDWFAVKSGEGPWLKRCWIEFGGDNHEGSDGSKGVGVQGLPNWSYSVALVEFEEECARKDELHAKSTERLMHAIYQFPQMIPQLLEKLTITAPAITTSPFFSRPVGKSKSDDAVDLLTLLYIERCSSLWKEPSVLAWLRATASQVASDDLSDQRKALPANIYPGGLPLNVSRHVYVSDFQSLFPMLPEEARKLSLNAFDPMPPPVVDAEEADDEGRTPVFGSVGWLIGQLRNWVAGGVGNAEESSSEDSEPGEIE
ncbi:Transcription factor 25 [Entophlyctis luteolus]|nr:Transcription factor 25 [Entophlyctis luteolus]